MENIYTNQNIDKFFEGFKSLQNSYTLEKVHQLLNNPNAKATHKVSYHFKHLKLIIVTTLTVSILSVFLIWINSINKSEPAILSKQLYNKKENPKQNELQLEEKNNRRIQTNQVEKQDISTKETKATPTDNKTNTANSKGNIDAPLTNLFVDTSTTNKTEDASLPPEYYEGEQFIVRLNDKELEDLGFLLDETGLYYKNRWKTKTKCFHAREEYGGGEMTGVTAYPGRHNKKETFSTFSFYPLYSTNYPVKPSNNMGAFEIQNDTLLPVYIENEQIKFGRNNHILWFIVNKELFDQLPTRYKNLEEKYVQLKKIKKRTMDLNLVYFKKMEKLSDKLNFIELNTNEWKKLGFYINEKDQLIYEINHIQQLEFNLTCYGIGPNTNKQYTNNNINLVYLTDIYGEPSIGWANDETTLKEKHSKAYISDKIQVLVPVVLRKDDFPAHLELNEEVLWFEPTNEFFNSLPLHIAKQLRSEYNFIMSVSEKDKQKTTTNCTYFEACRSTLNIHVNIYPNPASSWATIEFDNAEQLKGSISLVNITGMNIKTLVPNTLFPAGNNVFEVDLSGINNGIYLISINTNKGFKTQRLIVSH